MDLELYRLIRKNAKQRDIHRGLNVNPEEFSLFEFEFAEAVRPIDVEPLDHSRERDGHGPDRTVVRPS